MNPEQGHFKKSILVFLAAALWVMLSVGLNGQSIRVEPQGTVTPGTTLSIFIDMPDGPGTVEIEVAALKPGAAAGTGNAAETLYVQRTAVADNSTVKPFIDNDPTKGKIRLDMVLPANIPPGTYMFRAIRGPGAMPRETLVEIAPPSPGLIARMLASVRKIQEITADPYSFTQYFKGENRGREALGDLYLADSREFKVVARLTETGDCMQPTWSPDGKRIAYIRWINNAGQAWVLEMEKDKPTSPPRQLIKDFNGSVTNPLWSPDGSHIAFLSGGSLWVLKIEGETAHRVTGDEGIQRLLAWTKDSRQIIYSVEAGQTAAVLSIEEKPGTPVEWPGSEVRQVDIDGGETHRLAYAEFWNWLPYLSPDGTCLLYSQPVSGGGYLLWTREGTDFTRAQLRREGFDPAWSPQGERIGFVSAGASK